MYLKIQLTHTRGEPEPLLQWHLETSEASKAPLCCHMETHGKSLTPSRINRQGREGRAGTGKVFPCWAGEEGIQSPFTINLLLHWPQRGIPLLGLIGLADPRLPKKPMNNCGFKYAKGFDFP